MIVKIFLFYLEKASVINLNYEKIALAGNPNVGKSTVFNLLTGKKQHTGNWTGKTVEVYEGIFKTPKKSFKITDVPGTYSLTPHSKEECVARDFICFGDNERILVVCDAVTLERNLFFVYQIAELNKKMLLCVNLLDDATKKGISLNLKLLAYELGINVIGTSAKNQEGIENLKKSIREDDFKIPKPLKYSKITEDVIEYIYPSLYKMPLKFLNKKWLSLRILENESEFSETLNEFLGFDILKNENVLKAKENAEKFLEEKGLNKEEFFENITKDFYQRATETAEKVTVLNSQKNLRKQVETDKFLVGKYTSFIFLGFLLFVIFYITVIGANIPSEILSRFFFSSESYIASFLADLKFSPFFVDLLVKGGYRVLGWVVSVMLPPMAIFFPLFTLLEEFGILPRIAFCLDNKFQKANTSGKQALTICMGFGCNCVGVTGARIIDSKRERLIAILTNSFTICNGRFPAIIKLISLFLVIGLSQRYKSFVSALILASIIVFSVFVSLVVSNLLSKTLLKGENSHYILELPSFRIPKIKAVIKNAVIRRTGLILIRAVLVSFPAGIVIYLLLNTAGSFLGEFTALLSPIGTVMGLDGEILTAFILGIPANEIVLPILLMLYSGAGEIVSVENSEVIKTMLLSNGWNMFTALSFIMFSVFHFPCATTLITIFKETKSIKMTLLSFMIPTAIGIIISMIFNCISLLVA